MPEPFFSLTDLGLSASASQLLSAWLDQMQEAFPGYSPSAANLEYIQAQIFASFAADLAGLCGSGSTELFRTYAQTLVGLPYQQGVAAQAIITITARTTPTTIGTTSQALSVGGPIIQIPVVALSYGIAAGPLTITDPNTLTTQSYTTSGCPAGSTVIPITSVVPNFAYPVGSRIGGTQAYALPSLSQFTLDSLGFVNLAPVTINAGDTQNVTLTAVAAGVIFNGAGQGGHVSSVQQLPWVASTVAFAPATGGADPEDDGHYLDRVKVELQLQAPRPITATDYGTMALNFSPYPGTDQGEAGRATAVDGYNPADGTFNNTRMVTVAVTDDNGFALNNDTLYGYPGGTSANIITTIPTVNAGWGIAGWLLSLREINFIVNVINPTYSAIYVTVTVKAEAGWDVVSVQNNVQNTLLAYLSPQVWGLPPSSQLGWENTTTVFQSTLQTIIQNSAGVNHVVQGTLKYGLSPTPSNTNDLALPGPIALPVSSIITVPTIGITVQ